MGDIDPTQPLFRKMDLLPIPHSLVVRNTATNNSHATTSLDLLKFQWEEKDRYGNTPNMDVSRDDDDSNSFSWHPFDMWMAKTHVVEETSPQLDYNDTIRTQYVPITKGSIFCSDNSITAPPIPLMLGCSTTFL